MTGRRPRRRTRLKPQVREDLLDHRRLQDRRDDPQIATAVRAVLQGPELDCGDVMSMPEPNATEGVDPDWQQWPASYGWWLGQRQKIGIGPSEQSVTVGQSKVGR